MRAAERATWLADSGASTTTAVDSKPTLASTWRAVTGGGTIDDELLSWPADVFALTEAILARCEAYRFALSPPAGARWPPARFPNWSEAVVDAARHWAAWLDDRAPAIPDLVAEEWGVLQEGAETLEQLRDAEGWRTCEALLTLHAISDEACAGLGVALDASDCDGLLYRARGRELLARTGSLARIPTHLMRVLPKLRTPPNGTSLRSLARYATVQAPGVDVRWHKVLAHLSRIKPYDEGIHLLLLPWPLRVKESDFRPIDGTVDRLTKEPFGFFEFAPSEGLDFELVDRLLTAANDEVGQVNVLVLPESAVDHNEIDDLEALLADHRVPGLVTGVRQRSDRPGQFPGNWVHLGASTKEHWVHIRQSKHHRWSLDESQIYQYSFGMAQRSRPHGESASPVIALWKDPSRGVREIPLEPGAQAVLISASADRAIRRSSDGRRPLENGSEFFDVSVSQVRAPAPGSRPPAPRGAAPSEPVLESDELTILTCWAEALAEAVTFAPEYLDAVADQARAGAAWRKPLGLAEPSPQLTQALAIIGDAVRIATAADGDGRADALLSALRTINYDESAVPRLARRVIRSTIEQRQTRAARTEVLP